MLEPVARGIERLDAVLKRIDPTTVQALLAKVQLSSLGQIAHIKTLQNVVLGLEELAALKSTAPNLNAAIQKFCMAETPTALPEVSASDSHRLHRGRSFWRDSLVSFPAHRGHVE